MAQDHKKLMKILGDLFKTLYKYYEKQAKQSSAQQTQTSGAQASGAQTDGPQATGAQASSPQPGGPQPSGTQPGGAAQTPAPQPRSDADILKDIQQESLDTLNKHSGKELDANSSEKEVNSAYRKAQLKTHPDKGGNVVTNCQV